MVLIMAMVLTRQMVLAMERVLARHMALKMDLVSSKPAIMWNNPAPVFYLNARRECSDFAHCLRPPRCGQSLHPVSIHLCARPTALTPLADAKVKDVAAFLGLIRRGCEQYASKFPTWQSLFAMRSKAMEKAGIACQHRKMILRWVQKYR